MLQILFKSVALAAVAALLLTSIGRAATTATWDGANAGWTSNTHWSTAPAFPNNASTNVFDAILNGGNVTLNQAITINRLALSAGALDGPSSLTALEGLQWTGGAIRGSGLLALGGGASTAISGGMQPLILEARTVNLSGVANFTAGTIRGGSGARINNSAGAIFTAVGNASFFADFASPSYSFENAGTFIARSAAGAGFTSMDARFNNLGAVQVELTGSGVAHTLSLAGGGTHSGAFQLAANTAVELGGSTTLQSRVSFIGPGEVFVAGSITASGNVTADHLTVATGELKTGSSLISIANSGKQTGGITQINSGGTLRVSGGSGKWVLDEGALTGTGTLDASLDAQGTIAPGSVLGTLRVTGNAQFGNEAQLSIEIGGTSGDALDVLAIGGTTSLDGELHITLANGFRPDPAQAFTILTSSAVSGAFANAPLDGGRYTTADGLGSFQIGYMPGSVVLTAFVPEPSQLILGIGGMALCFGLRMRKGSLQRK